MTHLDNELVEVFLAHALRQIVEDEPVRVGEVSHHLVDLVGLLG